MSSSAVDDRGHRLRRHLARHRARRQRARPQRAGECADSRRHLAAVRGGRPVVRESADRGAVSDAIARRGRRRGARRDTGGDRAGQPAARTVPAGSSDQRQRRQGRDAAVRLVAGRSATSSVAERLEAVEATFNAQLEKQRRLASWLSVLSPTMVAQGVLLDIAGTSTSRFDRFRARGRRPSSNNGGPTSSRACSMRRR